MAMLCDALLVEAMRSATASACERSSLPLRKARWVYSPGRAARAPFWMRRLSTLLSMYREPWHEISAESSPV